MLFKKKELCVHCGKKKTKNAFEGHPTCMDCEINILIMREHRVQCPKCNDIMIKKPVEGIIIDKCLNCAGVWLDSGELDILRKSVESENGDFSTGFLLEMACG